MKLIVFIGGLAGLGVAGLGLATMRSDIQLIFAAVGFFGALILFGIGAVLSQLDRQWNLIADLEEQVQKLRQP